MDSSTIFWIAAITMSVLAMAFVAVPFIKQNSHAGLVGMGTALPVFATLLYLFVGSPQAASIEPRHRAPESHAPVADAAARGSVGSVASLVDGLAKRLQENPDNGKGWLLLARSYEHLDRIPEAIAAYDRAAELGEFDEGLASLKPGGSAGVGIAGSLQLSGRALAIVQPVDTVFVFARAPAAPMPVAALRRSAADLPFEFVLTDGHAMSVDTRLSNFERVTVTARISRSGNATHALKELEASSDTVTVGEDRHVKLIIDQKDSP